MCHPFDVVDHLEKAYHRHRDFQKPRQHEECPLFIQNKQMFCRVLQVFSIKAPLDPFYMLFHWIWCRTLSILSEYWLHLSIKLTCGYLCWRSRISGPEAGMCTAPLLPGVAPPHLPVNHSQKVHEYRKKCRFSHIPVIWRVTDIVFTWLKADHHHVQTFNIQAELLLHPLTCRRFCAESWIKEEGQGESDSSLCSNNRPQLTHAASIPALTLHIW